MVSPRSRMIRLVIIFFLVVALGTAGYMLLERWNLNDALFMTAITLSTVGFGEVRPLTEAGRVFTMILIFAGGGMIIYFLSSMAEYLVSINMEHKWHIRRSASMAKRMENHVIICGYGQVGKSAAMVLTGSGRDIVIIDADPLRIAAAHDNDIVAIQGDATLDETLMRAGIDVAESVIVCTGDDSQNLFIVLSARSVNSELFIISRANLAVNTDKLRRAGANRVVSPYDIGGQHMANCVMRPHVTDFFDVVTLPGGDEIWLEEQFIGSGSTLIGRSVVEADLIRRAGVTLVAIYRPRTKTNIALDSDTKLAVGDQLIVLGTGDQLAALEKLTEPPSMLAV